MGMGAEDRIADVVEMGNVNAFQKNAILEFGGIADDTARRNDNIPAKIGEGPYFRPLSEDGGAFDHSRRRNFDVGSD